MAPRAGDQHLKANKYSTKTEFELWSNAHGPAEFSTMFVYIALEKCVSFVPIGVFNCT